MQKCAGKQGMPDSDAPKIGLHHAIETTESSARTNELLQPQISKAISSAQPPAPCCHQHVLASFSAKAAHTVEANQPYCNHCECKATDS